MPKNKMEIIRVKRKRFKFFLNFSKHYAKHLIIKGPLGLISIDFPPMYTFALQSNTLVEIFVGTKAFANAFCNKLRLVIKGMIYGYFSFINTEGVGFKFLRYFETPQVITLSLGHTHTIIYKFPKNVYIRVLKYKLLLFSNCKHTLSEISLRIKSYRSPDAYKGKGLKFAKEVLVLKPGKQRQK